MGRTEMFGRIICQIICDEGKRKSQLGGRIFFFFFWNVKYLLRMKVHLKSEMSPVKNNLVNSSVEGLLQKLESFHIEQITFLLFEMT